MGQNDKERKKRQRKFIDQNILAIFTKIIEIEYGILPVPPEFYSTEVSKRNHVFCFRNPNSNFKIALKIYKIPEFQQAYSNEISVYETLAQRQFQLNDSCFVPKLLKTGDLEGYGYLILEYIEGNNLMEYITHLIFKEPMNNDSWKQLFDIIFSWLNSFYDVFQFIHLDTHIRNFILTSNNTKLYGVDFEDTFQADNRVETLINGIGKIYLSILGAYPGIFESRYIDYKLVLGQIWMDLLQNELGIDEQKIGTFFIKALHKEGNELIQRRLRLKHETKDDAQVAERNLNFIIKRLRDYSFRF